ncbi:P-loop containing nucleoside triphosphate hydrolase protein [Mariannaea sp. PMI_226]|nr:P-loop containing nucleoside triphosphate hydrolase protein [Mariannaea sp. PMI_226]
MIPLLNIASYLHYGCAFTILAFLSVSTLHHLGESGKTPLRSKTYTIFISILIICYLVEIAILITPVHTLNQPGADIVHLSVLAIVWLFIGLRRTTSRQTIQWATAITTLFEIPLLGLSFARPVYQNTSIMQTICQGTRLFAFLCLFATWFRPHTFTATSDEHLVEEARPFLRSQPDSDSSHNYGTQNLSDSARSESDETLTGVDDDSDSDDDDDVDIKRRRAKRLQQTGGWWGYLKDFSIFLPYLTPRGDPKVQLCLLVSLVCIAGGRALNILIPRQLGIVTDKILGHETPYTSLLVWLVLKMLYSECGLKLLEELAKIPIKQFSYRRIANAAFSHVMSLSMEFHSERDSAEVMKAIEQGEALTNILETAVIDILPTLVDLFIAYWLLYWKFNILLTVAMLVASIAFFSLEVVTSNWNIENRRQTAKTKRDESRVMHQAVQGWQTVTYFNMFSFERRRFGDAIEKQLAASRNWGRRDAYIQAILEAVVPITWFTLACLVVNEISHGRATPGDFVFLIQYWEFLIYPLQYLSHNYRYLMADLIDAERLLGLLQTRPTVVDKDGAKSLVLAKGCVKFEDVCFSYDPRKRSVQDLNISANPGETVAFVGATGAGKSTILKLLLRFYDVDSGKITIDDQDIRDVTLSSLRDVFGVVPQDPLLFNASVMENLRYARPSASNEEIFEACRSAAIHDKILSFPSGYETRVGEQGVRLSGGEVQRIAIARAFLRNAPILILDEATSAVDTTTETEIQAALDELKRQRTTFLIAHRLSTVVKADQIVVVHDGQIVERGTHTELIRANGRYHELWIRQVGGSGSYGQ